MTHAGRWLLGSSGSRTLLEIIPWPVRVEAEPQLGPNLAKMSMLDPSMLSLEARKRRYGDLGHLLPISGNSRNVQVRHPPTCSLSQQPTPRLVND